MSVTLNKGQQTVLKDIEVFLDSDQYDTFILKGYAGTGKTFLMQLLSDKLAAQKRSFKLLATTGRAAAILRGKTQKSVRTVHGELYFFNSLSGMPESEEDLLQPDKYGQLELLFDCRPPDKEKCVYIVDEASMLSDAKDSQTSFAIFGTGILLHDLFNAIGENKIIFVGDPCQLPPVNQSFSPALDETHLTIHYNRKVTSGELVEIVRIDSSNDVLTVATELRHLAQFTPNIRYPKLPAKGRNNVIIYGTPHELVHQYLQAVSQKGMERVIAIARGNATCHRINEHVRHHLWGDSRSPLQAGDVLMVTQNNYLVPLTNGDFVEVLEVGYEKHEGGLSFLEVRVRHLLTRQEHAVMLVKELLNGSQANITKEQSRSLIMSFTKRMKEKGILPKSEQYQEAMSKDPFLNSLRAVYGYAVTCHKAQGGEWDDVYLFLKKFHTPTEADRKNLIRWWYTSVTRTRNTLHLHNDWWVQ